MKKRKIVTKVSLGARILSTDSIGKQIINYAERKRWLDLSNSFQRAYRRVKLKDNFDSICKILRKRITYDT